MSAGPARSENDLTAEARDLVATIKRTPPQQLATDAAVRAATRRYAQTAREREVRPERFLVALKSLVSREAIPEIGEWYRTVITDRVIVWAIEDYYRLPDDLRPDDPAER